MKHKRNYTAIYRSERAGEINHVTEHTTSKRTLRRKLQAMGNIVLMVYTDYEIRLIRSASNHLHEPLKVYEQYVTEVDIECG